MLAYSRNEQGAALITATVFAFIISLLGISYFRMGGLEGGLVYSKENSSQALFSADAGIDYAEFRLNYDSNCTPWLSATPILVGSIGTIESVESNCISSTGDNKIFSVTSVGKVGDVTRTIEATIEKKNIGALADIVAAVTGPITLKGSITIDGRDHDEDENLIVNNGTYALRIPESMSKADVIAQSASTTVGGTVAGTDYAPITPCDPADPECTFNMDLIHQGEVFYTPHEVMHYESEEELIQLAKSIGSYYNVSVDGLPDQGNNTLEVSGLTYVDFTGMGDYTWNSPDIEGKGILIVHNDDEGNNVTIKPLTKDFNGIMIVDNISNIAGNTTLLGALYIFNDSETSLGMGTSEILFSRDMIEEVLEELGESRLTAWREVY